MVFVGNLTDFPAVNGQSYRHEFGVLLFWGHGGNIFFPYSCQPISVLFRLIALPNGHIVSTQIVLIIGLPKLTILPINR